MYTDKEYLQALLKSKFVTNNGTKAALKRAIKSIDKSRPVEKLVSKKFADAVIDCIPTNWIDPLLTGKTAVLKGYDYKPDDIENLLRALKERVKETVSKFSC